MSEITYKQAGVDIDEGVRAVDAIKDAVRATYTPEVIGDLGGFGGLFSAAALKEMDDPILVSGTDGVGTKLELAKRVGNHASVGIDLVAMCANDIVTCGARPLFFLDYIALGALDAAFVAEVVGGIAEGCKQAGCALIGGEMAEHPGVMAATDYDLSGFCVGAVDRAQMIGPDRVGTGDVIVGLASSGLHSNGYSLVRRAFTDGLSDEELHSKTLPDFGAASGGIPSDDVPSDGAPSSGAVSDDVPDTSNTTTLAEALLAPTRMYVKDLLGLIKTFGADIHAAAHITGGGITENLNRALPKGNDALIKRGSWAVPPVIEAVIDAASLSEEEALKTFNMGIGLAIIVESECASKVLKQLGDDAVIIGKIIAATLPDSEPCVCYE
ncbi:MAG: phosphoribosylformylglycinamidine cyclo-ligase [Coriobacteriales bacterium]|jgi:phosphoribosylformylglycinamidine cyclo-ligase|nr:phosphoribosylformylglycinamidine cyclo-ligase [Coriobacteriales bacterium]